MSFYSSTSVNPEEREKYRHYVSGFDISVEEQNALIDIVHSIMSYFVDQAFCVQTDQITLQSVGKRFGASPDHANAELHFENLTADGPSDGVESDSNPLGPSEP
jgi:hypothetical protein